jgi:Ca2+-binding RTX toxin-like protein
MTTRLVRALPIAAVLAASLAAPVAAAVINGTDGPDTLVGTTRADTIRGFAGNDTLAGRAGADKLYGGRGSDRMYAGGDARRDLLYGGPGPDRIYARMYDRVYAGSGNDVIRYVGVHGFFHFLQVSCGPGYDIVYGGWQAAILGGCEDLRPHSDNPLL